MKQQDSLETMVANFIDNSASNFLYNDVYYYRSICDLYGQDAVNTEIIRQKDKKVKYEI